MGCYFTVFYWLPCTNQTRDKIHGQAWNLIVLSIVYTIFLILGYAIIRSDYLVHIFYLDHQHTKQQMQVHIIFASVFWIGDIATMISMIVGWWVIYLSRFPTTPYGTQSRAVLAWEYLPEVPMLHQRFVQVFLLVMFDSCDIERHSCKIHQLPEPHPTKPDMRQFRIFVL